MKKILDYLNLRNVGLLEMLFALTPILMGFNLGPIPLSALMWVVMIGVVALQKGKLKLKNFKPLMWFIIYWFVHQLFLLFVTNFNVNTLIVQVVYFAAVFFLYPVMDLGKMRGSFNWVAIISILGLLYQWADVAQGNGVHPLEIPGLTMPEGRMEHLILRPSSFYMEPAAYVAYMICPIALALVDKKYIWAILMILSVFLTTSTTGIVLSFILLVASLFANKAKGSSMLIVLVVGAGMVYALNTLEEFSAGVEKLENTDASTSVRLSQGIHVVQTMHTNEYIFGVPYSDAYNYCKSGRCTDVEYYGESVYMPTFWDLILRFGIVGLILYLSIYVKILRMSKKTIPLCVALLSTMFSSGYSIGPMFVFTLIVLLVMARFGEKGLCS